MRYCKAHNLRHSTTICPECTFKPLHNKQDMMLQFFKRVSSTGLLMILIVVLINVVFFN